jgi:hypothetical protein
MNYSQRHHELNAQFQLGKDTHLNGSDIDIRFFSFQSKPPSAKNKKVIVNPVDEKIYENLSFTYPVFIPKNIKISEKAILLLHGLNERNWSKYLTWAEYLCDKTGKPVILFPIAFHINRSPQSWSNPRDVQTLLDLRRQQNFEDRSLSFANVTFSERISEEPYRFYSSGRQSINDLCSLFEQIKKGSHPLFLKNTQIDFFAYSIGAFLAEITMIANPYNLFSDSKLFLFCGGGIFSAMFGQSRSIMDKTAYEKLYSYYLNEFSIQTNLKSARDKIFNSFNCMISPDRNRKERESFFKRLGNKIMGISLVNDKVMPFYGMMEAIGKDCFESRFKMMDFSFPYTHENPFPVGGQVESSKIDNSFTEVFSQAALFLT